MNWYKKAQSRWSWGNFMATFGPTVIAGLLALNQFGLLDLQKAFADPKSQQQVIQQAKEVQQQNAIQPQQDIFEESLINRLEEGKQDVPIASPEEEKNLTVVEEEPQQSTSDDINLDKIWQLESSKGTDPDMRKPNRAGALGHFQFLKKTWDEMVSKMGKDWDWRTDSLDYKKSQAVADYYLNTEIPRLLRHFNIPDTIETRLGAYNWGIGNVKNAWEEYGSGWVPHSNSETIGYIRDYKG